MNRSKLIRKLSYLGMVGALVLIGVGNALAEGGTVAEVYGHVMLDMGYQTGQSDPDWFDVMRPTKLPSFENEYGQDGRFFSGVRQSRFGIKTDTATDMGQLKTIFEFELFGTGVDAGQTTFRLRHAYGELGKFGAGQTWSPFMDIGVFPNTLEYWGPNGMVFFRNVQLRWMPIQGDTHMTIALERPGASGHPGEYQNGIEANEVQARFSVPDLSAEYHLGTGFGYIELAGILRQIQWDDLEDNDEDYSGTATGWGLNLSTNINTGEKGTIRGQLVVGEGIANYMNDATYDVAAVATTDPAKPVEGKALPVLGAVLFYDINWSPRWTSSLGYSMMDIDNVAGQDESEFSKGHYAILNLLYHPLPNVLMGLEGQYGKRENFEDGFTSDDFRIQFSAKYNFSTKIGG